VNCSLIVPWKYAEDRARIWNYLWPAWEHEGFEVILAEVYRHDPWCKGRAWAEGLKKASCDVVCLMDADCWVPRLSEAVGLLSKGHRWVQGQELVLRYDKATTLRLLDGDLTLEEACRLPDPWEDVPRKAGAGVGTILWRDDAEEIPIDRRIIGWGWEDNAWWEALSTLLGEPARLPGSICFHLHHQPQPSKDRKPTSQNANWLLYRQYVRARGRPDRMRAVLSGA
jgi:hypothetical protein